MRETSHFWSRFRQEKVLGPSLDPETTLPISSDNSILINTQDTNILMIINFLIRRWNICLTDVTHFECNNAKCLFIWSRLYFIKWQIHSKYKREHLLNYFIKENSFFKKVGMEVSYSSVKLTSSHALQKSIKKVKTSSIYDAN